MCAVMMVTLHIIPTELQGIILVAQGMIMGKKVSMGLETSPTPGFVRIFFGLLLRCAAEVRAWRSSCNLGGWPIDSKLIRLSQCF